MKSSGCYRTEQRNGEERQLHGGKAPVNKGKDGGPGGMPAYKGFKKTRLGASNVATLEKIWETGNHYPDDATISRNQRRDGITGE